MIYSLLFRASANTRIGVQRVRTVRVRGGSLKFRALRLDQGNFAWGSEGNLLVHSALILSTPKIFLFLQAAQGRLVFLT